jgi:hypothetical protein
MERNLATAILIWRRSRRREAGTAFGRALYAARRTPASRSSPELAED